MKYDIFRNDNLVSDNRPLNTIEWDALVAVLIGSRNLSGGITITQIHAHTHTKIHTPTYRETANQNFFRRIYEPTEATTYCVL